MEKYEVVIVGAGPGGLKAAEILAKAGKKVIVLEQNKIIGDKVCAGGITPKVFELEVPKKIMGKCFKEILFNTPLQKTKLKQKKNIICTVDRVVLGKWMAQQAKKAGAKIKTNSGVDKIGEDYVIVGNKKIGFKYLIGADGGNSIVRKHLGLGNEKICLGLQYKTKKKFKDLEFIFDYDKFGPSYAWIFPHKKFTSIGVAMPNQKGSKKIRNNFNRWCNEMFDTSKAKFEAHILRCGYEGFQFKNKFLVGEAAGFVSYFTGEGIYFAMLSGIDVAKKIIDKKYDCPGIKHILSVKKYQDSFEKHLSNNKILGKIEIEILALLSKSNWISKEIIEHIE